MVGKRLKGKGRVRKEEGLSMVKGVEGYSQYLYQV
jgi:hypothetical protein